MSRQSLPSGTDLKDIPYDTPYKTPPAGQVSHFDHPDTSLRNTMIITMAVTLTAALLATAARFWTRVFVVRKLWWDDYLCFLAFALTVAFNASVAMRFPYGLGIPTWDIRLVEYFGYTQQRYNFWGVVMNLIRNLALMFLKICMLVLYLRILGAASALYRRTRWVVVASIVFVAAYNISMIAWLTALCDPPIKAYYPKHPGTCKYSLVWKQSLALAGLNVFADFLIFSAPLPMIYKLQMPVSQKLATVFTLVSGLAVCAATIVNLVISVKIIRQESTEDPLQLWIIIEVNLGMMVVSLPAMRQLFVRAITRLESLSGRSSSKENDSKETPNSSRRPSRMWNIGGLGTLRDSGTGSKSNIVLTQEMKQFDEENNLPPPSHTKNGESWGLDGHGFVFADVEEVTHPPDDKATKEKEREPEMGTSTFVYAK